MKIDMKTRFFKKRAFLFACVGIASLAIIIIAKLFIFGKSDSTLYSWDVISRGDIRETISASGQLQAKKKVNIGTTVMGEILELHVADGQDVKAGDLLW